MAELLYRRVYEELKRRIFAGELKADEPIPNQVALSELFQVSEVTIKRALKELVDEGLIIRYRKKGTFIDAQRLKEALAAGAGKRAVEVGVDSGGGGEREVREVQEVQEVQEWAFRHQADSRPLPTTDEPFNLDTIYLVHSTYMRMLEHAFMVEMMQGIVEEADRYGIAFLICSIDEALPLPNRPTAGYLMLSSPADVRAMELWQQEGRHIVNVHMSYPHLSIPYIIVDNYTGGYLATQHLLALEHRRIGIILPEDEAGDVNQEFSFRLQGYMLALSQYRVDRDPELIAKVTRLDNGEDIGYEACQRLLASSNPPTAIFATTDYMAIGAIRAIQERGLRVPEDISVIGYDNVAVGSYMAPRLTTVHQHSRLLGKRAVEMLLAQERDGRERRKGQEGQEGRIGRSGELQKDTIVPELVIRGSTAAVRGEDGGGPGYCIRR